MEVGFSFPKPSCLYMEYSNRFTQAPKSISAFSTLKPLILTEIVGHPRSLYFTGVLHSMITLTCSVKKAFLFTLKPLFIVHKSFKNFAYVRTCLIMSRRGMLTFTYRNTSKILVWLTKIFFFQSACGKGGGYTGLLLFPFCLLFFLWQINYCGSVLVGAGTVGLSSLPLHKVTTTLTSSILAFELLAEPISCTPLGFCCAWEGNFPFSGPCCWLDNLAFSECIMSNFF